MEHEVNVRKVNTKRKEKWESMVILTINLLFFFAFTIYDGVIIASDSYSYITESMAREALYPLLLRLFRVTFFVFEEGYLTAVVIAQTILTAIAVWSLTQYFHKKFKLSFAQANLINAVSLITALVWRCDTGWVSMYYNSILTEGITCALFLLFFRYLTEYILDYKVKSLIAATIFSFLLVSARKQMYITLILLTISILYVGWRLRKTVKAFCILILCAAGILLSTSCLEYGYSYFLRGTPMRHTSDNRFVATMVFYVSQKEDAEVIADEKIRNLFLQIRSACDAGGYLQQSAQGGWSAREKHFVNSYDCIQLDIMDPMVGEYVSNMYGGSEKDFVERVDAIRGDMITDVLPHVWMRIIPVVLDNFAYGLVTTNSLNTPLLVLCSVLGYVLYVILLAVNVKYEGISNTSILGIFTLICIVVNVGVVSMVIFCQTRYTIYMMPLFYISGFLLLRNFVLNIGKRKKKT